MHATLLPSLPPPDLVGSSSLHRGHDITSWPAEEKGLLLRTDGAQQSLKAKKKRKPTHWENRKWKDKAQMAKRDMRRMEKYPTHIHGSTYPVNLQTEFCGRRLNAKVLPKAVDKLLADHGITPDQHVLLPDNINISIPVPPSHQLTSCGPAFWLLKIPALLQHEKMTRITNPLMAAINAGCRPFIKSNERSASSSFYHLGAVLKVCSQYDSLDLERRPSARRRLGNSATPSGIDY